MTKAKWLIYCVGIGLVPAAARLLVAALAAEGQPVAYVSATDVIGYGLVLVATNVNGLEHETVEDHSWKTRNIGVSFLAAMFFALLFMAAVLSEQSTDIFRPGRVRAAALLLAATATAHSFAVWDRLLARQVRR